MKLLVPIDFSYHAAGALRLALSLANRWRASVTALHVDPLPGVGTVSVEPVYIPPHLFQGLHADHDRRVEANLSDIRAELEAGAGDGVAVDAVLRRGDPVSGIAEFASEWGADLMIMGSQGTSGFAHLLLGSTAEKVSRIAPCPVLVAGRADDGSREARSLGRVIAAVDYSEFSIPVARLAAKMAAPDGSVELLHVWSAPYLSALNASLGGDREDIATMTANAREAHITRIQEFMAAVELPDTRLSTYIATGTAAAGILNRAEETRADLLVLGAHSRSNLSEQLIGTVADRVLRHADIPVLLVPPGALPGARSQPRDSD